MKTITMGFEQYERELLSARNSGSLLLLDTFKVVKIVIKQINEQDGHGLSRTVRDLQELVERLEKPPTQQEISQGIENMVR